MNALLALIPWPYRMLAALALIILAYVGGYAKGAGDTRIAAEINASKEALSRIQNLEKNNASFHSLPDRERCLVFMHDSRLPASECDQR